jgi:undecaprenyl-phosphate galactose phosphotransferase/putative colanic acid biosynthesis UDP-glucose lipid carrier transferase
MTIFFISNLLWYIIVVYTNAYEFIRVEYIERILTKTIQLVLFLFISIFTIIVVLHFREISRLRILYFAILFLCSIIFFRVLFLELIKAVRKKGYNFRTVIIVGMGKSGLNIYSFLSKDLSYGYKILGFFEDEPEDYSKKFNVLGKVSEVKEYVENNAVDEVYITLSDYPSIKIKEIIDACEHNLIRIKFVPNFNKFTQTRRVSIDFYGNIPVVSLRKEPLESPLNRLIKRLFDMIFSLTMIVFLFSWLFPILMLLVKLTSKGPIFFKQERSGEDNKPFICWKFRTMAVNNDADKVQATKNDARITKIGKFFRKTNIDELPQFFNVLIGNMSVVGPRPHMLKHTEEYSGLIKNYLVRHFIKPGITGWSQVNGLRGETTELDQMTTRVEFDIWYIENWTFLLDIKIIVKTILNMVKGDENAI